MMPDLPNVGWERDMESFREFFENPAFRSDGLKVGGDPFLALSISALRALLFMIGLHHHLLQGRQRPSAITMFLPADSNASSES